MSGLISTGSFYKNQAMSGFIRESEEEQRRVQFNKQAKQAQKQNNIAMGASAATALLALIL